MRLREGLSCLPRALPVFLRINSSVPHISQPFASFHNHCVPLSLLFSVSACACVLACSHVCIYNIHACRCTGVSVYDRGKLPVDFNIHVVEAESLLLILLMHRVPQASCPLSFWPIFPPPPPVLSEECWDGSCKPPRLGSRGSPNSGVQSFVANALPTMPSSHTQPGSSCAACKAEAVWLPRRFFCVHPGMILPEQREKRKSNCYAAAISTVGFS